MVKPVFDLPAVIAQLTTSWGDNNTSTRVWASTTVNFFIADASTPPTNSPTTPDETPYQVTLTANQLLYAALSFRLWDDLIPIDLVASPSPDADISFAYASQTWNSKTKQIDADGGTYAGAGVTDGNFDYAQIWLNSNWTSNQDPGVTPGGYGLATMIHEIGHVLGLSHPGTYDASDAVDPTYQSDAVYAQDTRQYTQMSYFYGLGTGTWSESPGPNALYGATPMVDDISAIQFLYGADMETRTGNTRYGYSSSFDENDAEFNIYDFSVNLHPVFTIWDAGGIDTIDTYYATDDEVIILQSGAYSSILGLHKNIAIARGVTIENGFGGFGNDSIQGNDADNVLRGGSGNDTLKGGAGDDSLEGGADLDLIIFDDATAAILIDLTAEGTGVADLNGAGLGLDRFSGVEGVLAGDFNDTILGSLQSETLQGGEGADSIDGGGGNDDIFGFRPASSSDIDAAVDGGDTLRGGAGDDWISGGPGPDHIYGDDGNDSLLGGDGSYIDGGNGNDTITASHSYGFGGDGDDKMNAGASSTLEGGAGADTLETLSAEVVFMATSYDDGADSMTGGTRTFVDYSALGSGHGINLLLQDGSENANVLVEGGETDHISHIFRAIGGAGDDVFRANNNRNIFMGGLGADRFIAAFHVAQPSFENEGGYSFSGGGGSDTIDYSEYTDEHSISVILNTGLTS